MLLSKLSCIMMEKQEAESGLLPTGRDRTQTELLSFDAKTGSRDLESVQEQVEVLSPDDEKGSQEAVYSLLMEKQEAGQLIFLFGRGKGSTRELLREK